MRGRALTLLVAAVGCSLLVGRPTMAAADGFAPQPTYRWVHPPSFFAPGNTAPSGVTASVHLGHDGSDPANVATPDGQLVLDLAPGAIPPRAGADRVAVVVTPLDARHLPPVPDGLRANGNAYRVAMTYEPGHRPVTALAHAASLVVEVPEIGPHLFTSIGGRHWSALDAQAVPPSNRVLSAPTLAPGYVVAATDLPELVAPGGGSSDSTLGIALAVGGATLLLGVAAILIARRRARRARGTTSRSPSPTG